jgi:hypothetical protein
MMMCKYEDCGGWYRTQCGGRVSDLSKEGICPLCCNDIKVLPSGTVLDPDDIHPQRQESPVPRDAIVRFSRYMEQKLKINDHKKHWNVCSDQYLLSRLKEEVFELEQEMGKSGSGMDVIQECADVANFAMMIADNFRRRIPGEDDLP